MTLITAAQLFGLMVVFPSLSKWGVVFYTKIHKRRHNANGVNVSGSIHTEEREPLVGEDDQDDPHSEFSVAHFDVYLLRLSYFVGALFALLVGFARTNAQMVPRKPPLLLTVTQTY
jgi:hypothetical protein